MSDPFLDKVPIVGVFCLLGFFLNLAKVFEGNAWKLQVLTNLNAEVLIFRKACISYLGMLCLLLFKISCIVIGVFSFPLFLGNIKMTFLKLHDCY